MKKDIILPFMGTSLIFGGVLFLSSTKNLPAFKIVYSLIGVLAILIGIIIMIINNKE